MTYSADFTVWLLTTHPAGFPWMAASGVFKDAATKIGAETCVHWVGVSMETSDATLEEPSADSIRGIWVGSADARVLLLLPPWLPQVMWMARKARDSVRGRHNSTWKSKEYLQGSKISHQLRPREITLLIKRTVYSHYSILCNRVLFDS